MNISFMRSVTETTEKKSEESTYLYAYSKWIVVGMINYTTPKTPNEALVIEKGWLTL